LATRIQGQPFSVGLFNF